MLTDRGTPVSDDYTCQSSNFNGKISWIQIDLGEDAKKNAHQISPEDRYQLAMALQ